MTDSIQLTRKPATDITIGDVMVTHKVEWEVDNISTTRYGIHVTVHSLADAREALHNEVSTGVFTYGPSDLVSVRS
jgi:hypothetical protein